MNADTPSASGSEAACSNASAAARGGESMLDAIAGDTLARLRAQGTWREMHRMDGAQRPRMCVDGRDVLQVSGSNYLDLAHHPEVVEAAVRAAQDVGCAAGGSRLICGNFSLHEALSDWPRFSACRPASPSARIHGQRRVAHDAGGTEATSSCRTRSTSVDRRWLPTAGRGARPRQLGRTGRSAAERAIAAGACCSCSMASTAWTATPPLRQMLTLARAHGALVMSTMPLRNARGARTRRCEWLGVEDGMCGSERSARRSDRSVPSSPAR